jgi:hypothetical protein
MAARLRIAPLAALALVATLAHAQVYQWKDAKGVTHYSDAPPAKGQEFKARSVDAPTPRTSPAATPAAPVTAPETVPADAQPPDKAANQAAARARAKANCETATANLTHLKAGGAIGYDADGDGKPDKVLTAEERTTQTQVAESNVATYCRDDATAQ